ncbi:MULTISPECIES: PadR family transcriptional regulator [unclassified Streptococcus]|uniref:PadR family transcriptional regulator n=1 Tax=unclassified Streptococcus TaxID=2608887 RepID=UPI001072249E|nr:MULTISPECIES: PadR family transcriptional regulator [unclassified Streptococcus]MBF0788052.1 PadR family transcriptional regulator [Streptococcus sp. 19428wC2_LYSM12]MCQ9211865.1 PadR family transcriptional regulator [Streptococcus sp. B01]MCQ9212986.1 PadR family transcriptional regulator [Streptococcus sp. O1]TFV04924.1 PadR family transcriptional regulator [Streptococcus sp. LYSM12]
MYFPVPAVLTEFLILAILESNDSYGYEISQTIKLIANIKESALYPILKKMEQNNYLATYSQEYQGRTRKYYGLTQLGHEHLTNLKEDWDIYTSTINGIIEGSIRHDKN